MAFDPANSAGPGVGVALVEVNVAGGGWQPATGTDKWRFDLIVPNVASLSVQVRATDAYGQVGPVQTVNYVVDNVGPTVTINPPAVFTSSSPVFNGTAVDAPANSSLTSIDVKVNDNKYASAIRTATLNAPTGPETFGFALGTVSADGVVYSVTARAVDEAGNTGFSTLRTFIVDNVGPRITTTVAVTQVNLPAGNVLLLQGTVSDGSGVAKVEVRTYDPNGNVYTESTVLSNGTWAYTPTQPLIAGLYSQRVFATDIYGNVSDVGPYDFEAKTPTGPTPTQTNTPEAPSPSPTLTPSASPTAEPTSTHTPTSSPTLTPVGPTPTKTNTPTPTNSPTATNTPVGPTPTKTNTPTPTSSPTATNTPGGPTPTKTNTPTVTATATKTMTPIPTSTPSVGTCNNNLLQNPGFELPLVAGQNIQYWTELPYEGRVKQGTGWQADGVNSAFIGPGEKLYQDVTATAGRAYTYTFWAGTHDPNQNEVVALQFLNASNAVIGQQVVNIDYDVDDDHTPPRITLYSVQMTAPAGSVKVRVIGQNSGNNIFKLDANCLTSGGAGAPTATAAPTATKTVTPSPTATKTPTPSPTPLVQVCTGNLLQNWSFEMPLVAGQNIQFWTEQPSEGSVTQGTGYQADGINGAFIGPGRRVYQDVSVTAGRALNLNFWAGTHDPYQNETVQLQFLNAAGNVISQQTVAIDYDVDNDNAPPRVTNYAVAATAPAGTVKVRVLGRNDGNNTFKLDAVCLK